MKIIGADITETPMRVLCITVRADYGGGPAHMLTLITEGACLGVKYFVACPHEKPYWERFAESVKGRMIEIPHRRFDLFRLPQLVSSIQKNKIDVIHSHGKGAGVYARILSLLTGKPCIHTLHGIHVGQLSFFKRHLYLMYERFSCRWVDHLIYVSNGEKDHAGRLSLFRNVSGTVIYNGVEIPDLQAVASKRQKARKELFGDSDPFVIGTLSRFDFQKNMEEAFFIAKLCPDLTFLWIGDGQNMALLKKSAGIQGITNIVFLGFTDQPAYYLSACDAYLSTSRWEGLPLAILEAMSIGLPVIASRVVGNTEAVLDGETGFLYESGDIAQAASLLKKIVNPDIRARLGARAANISRAIFDKKKMVEETVSLYARVKGSSVI